MRIYLADVQYVCFTDRKVIGTDKESQQIVLKRLRTGDSISSCNHLQMIPAMERFIPCSSRVLLLALSVAFFSQPGSTVAPRGCGAELNPLYYYLCDLDAVWGIVVEAFAAVGVITCLIIFVVLLASLPFISNNKRRRSLPLDVAFVVATLGLFGLTFAFIVGNNFSTCASRRFLFGVLFAACLSCLLMKAVKLNFLSRYNKAPRAWALNLGAMGFWLVEVIINTEWLIITIVRYPINATSSSPVPCNIANQDFVMALIYVMVLLVVVMVASIVVLGGKHRQWYKDGLFIFITVLFSLGIWVAWIVMYTYGNEKHGTVMWNDPTLAIALVANAWVFLLFYTMPEICHLTDDDDEEGAVVPQDMYTPHAVGYETILKMQRTQNSSMDNKAFTMDEPSTGNKPVSPYNGYNGQIRNSVYQPTELALITKGPRNQAVDFSYDTAIPRASLCIPHIQSTSGSSSVQPDNGHISNGNGLHWKPQW